MNVLIDRLFLLDHIFFLNLVLFTRPDSVVYTTRKTHKIQDRSHQHNGTSSYYVLVIICYQLFVYTTIHIVSRIFHYYYYFFFFLILRLTTNRITNNNNIIIHNIILVALSRTDRT